MTCRVVTGLLWAGLIACSGAVWAQSSPVLEPAVCYPPQVDWSQYEWVLIKRGRVHHPACDEMLTYLRSRPTTSPPPVCLKERLPQHINWSSPDWKVVPEEQRAVLMKEIAADLGRLGTQMQKAKEWKVVRTDVTEDDHPETLLAYGDGSADCYKVTRCAVPEGPMKGYISLTRAAGGNTSLMPMSEDGQHILPRQSRGKPLVRYGELVYYKMQPYWISPLRWEQKVHDNHAGNPAATDPRNYKNRMFQMAPLKRRSLKKRKRLVDVFEAKPLNEFKSVYSMYPDPKAACFFGYFHRETIK